MKKIGLLLVGLTLASSPAWGVTSFKWKDVKDNVCKSYTCILGDEEKDKDAENQYFIIVAEASKNKIQVLYKKDNSVDKAVYRPQYYNYGSAEPQQFGWTVKTNSGSWGLYGSGVFQCMDITHRFLNRTSGKMREEIVTNGYFGGNCSGDCSECDYKIRHSIIYQQGDKHISHSASLTPLKDSNESISLFFGGDTATGNSDAGFPYFDPVLGYAGVYECSGGVGQSCSTDRVGDTFFVLQPSSAGYLYESGKYNDMTIKYPKLDVNGNLILDNNGNPMEESVGEGIIKDIGKGKLSCHPNREQVYLKTETDPQTGEEFYKYTLNGEEIKLNVQSDLGIKRPKSEFGKIPEDTDNNPVKDIISGINNSIRYSSDYWVDAGLATQWMIPANELKKQKTQTFYVSQCFDQPCLHQSSVTKEFRVLNEVVDAKDLEEAGLAKFIENGALTRAYTLDNAAGEMICKDQNGRVIDSDRTDFVPGKRITCSVKSNKENKYTFIGWAQIDKQTGNNEPDGSICNLNNKGYQYADFKDQCVQSLKAGPAKSGCYDTVKNAQNNNKLFVAVFAQVKTKFQARVEEGEGGKLKCYALIPNESGDLLPKKIVDLPFTDKDNNKYYETKEMIYGYNTPISCFATKNTDYNFDGWSSDGTSLLENAVVDKLTLDTDEASSMQIWEDKVSKIDSWDLSNDKVWLLQNNTLLSANFSTSKQVKIFTQFTEEVNDNGIIKYENVDGETANKLNNLLTCVQDEKKGVPVFNAKKDAKEITCTLDVDELSQKGIAIKGNWQCEVVDEKGAPISAGSCNAWSCTSDHECKLKADQHQRLLIGLIQDPRLKVDEGSNDQNMFCEITKPSLADDTNPVTPGNSGRPQYNTEVTCNFDPKKGNLQCIDPSDKETCKALNTCNSKSPCIFNVSGDIIVSVEKKIKLTLKVDQADMERLADIQCKDEIGTVVNLGDVDQEVRAGNITCSQKKKDSVADSEYGKYSFQGWSVNGVPPTMNNIHIDEDSIIIASFNSENTIHISLSLSNEVLAQLDKYGLTKADIRQSVTCEADGGSVLVVANGNNPSFTIDKSLDPNSNVTCRLDLAQGGYEIELGYYQPYSERITVNSRYQGPGIVGGSCTPSNPEPGQQVSCQVETDSKNPADSVTWTIESDNSEDKLSCISIPNNSHECTFTAPKTNVRVTAVGKVSGTIKKILLGSAYLGEGIQGISCTSLNPPPGDSVTCTAELGSQAAEEIDWSFADMAAKSGCAINNPPDISKCTFIAPSKNTVVTATGVVNASDSNNHFKSCHDNVCDELNRGSDALIVLKLIRGDGKGSPAVGAEAKIPLPWLVYVLLLLVLPGGVYFSRRLRKGIN